MLRELKADFDVPTAAFNVVLEGLAHHNLDKALDLYRHVRQIIPAGPDITTFRHLNVQVRASE